MYDIIKSKQRVSSQLTKQRLIHARVGVAGNWDYIWKKKTPDKTLDIKYNTIQNKNFKKLKSNNGIL